MLLNKTIYRSIISIVLCIVIIACSLMSIIFKKEIPGLSSIATAMLALVIYTGVETEDANKRKFIKYTCMATIIIRMINVCIKFL